MEFNSFRNISVHLQVYIYAGWIGLILYQVLTTNQLIRYVGQAHPTSLIALIVWGIYIIRPPYYQVDNYSDLFFKLAKSLWLMFAALVVSDGTWDIIYAYYNPTLNAFILNFNSIISSVIIVMLFIATGWYKMFNKKRLTIGALVIAGFYAYWVALGFPTTNDPRYVSNLFVNMFLESGHWWLGTGVLVFAYDYKNKIEERISLRFLLLVTIGMALFLYSISSHGGTGPIP